MPSIHRSALMPFSAQTMYEIVSDVAKYPDYLPWCGDCKILSQSDTSMKAAILMKKGKVNHWFSTQNVLVVNRRIEITLIDGPFKRLDGVWQFIELDQESSKIMLDLSFQFPSGLVSTLVAPVFTQIANTMVDSFCSRAYEIGPA
ncbi:MAG: type II toxin-antitoxin system RatA family toxin [Gammaproteobacteria bacterium]